MPAKPLVLKSVVYLMHVSLFLRSTAVLEVLLLLDAAAVSGVAPSAVLSVMPF